MTALVAVVALLAVGVTAASAKRHATVTLNVLMFTTAQPGFQIMNANFERVYPDIKINATFLPSADVYTLLATQFQAGNAPDVFTIAPARTNPASTWTLADAGRLLDLTGRPWQKRIYPAAKAQSTYKGKVYGWPTFVQPHAIIYNTDLAAQLGVKPPTTFAQLLAQCKQIRAAGKVPFMQSFSTTAGGIIIGRILAANFVYAQDPTWDAKRAAKKVTFASSPLWRRMFQAFVEMKDANCFNEGSQGTSRPQQYAQFAQGAAVYSMITSGELSNMQVINPNLKVQMFNFPPDNPKKQLVQAYGGIILSGNAATKYPAQVKTFIDFYARVKQSTLLSKVSSAIAPWDATKGILPTFMKPMATLFKAGKTDPPHDANWPGSNLWVNTVSLGLTGLITGQTNIDGILANADQLWDAG